MENNKFVTSVQANKPPIEEVKNPEKIRTLIRLGQSINTQRWRMGLDPEAQKVIKKLGLKKEDIGSRIDRGR